MGKKVLIIDDSQQDRLIIKRFLGKAGFEDVSMATSGEEGVEKVKGERFDLVILDTMLPGMDGFQTCSQIFQLKDVPVPKIVMTTGAIDAVDAVKARKAGASDYCVKTSNPSHLVETVRKLFQE